MVSRPEHDGGRNKVGSQPEEPTIDARVYVYNHVQ